MSTSLFSQTFRHNGSAVFGTMPPMCRSCPDVNKLRGMETTILGQHRPFMSIKSFVQHSGWQEMVSLCSLIRLIGVCADRDQPEFLCSRSDSRHLEVHVATAGGWLTRYRPREVRNSIYRYRKIHIDYRSKYLYRFISPISIIYGNTNLKASPAVQSLQSCKQLQVKCSEEGSGDYCGYDGVPGERNRLALGLSVLILWTWYLNANKRPKSTARTIMQWDLSSPGITGPFRGNTWSPMDTTGLILGLHPANERRRYFVTTSLIGWAQA